MSTLSEQAKTAVEKLLQSDETQLYEQLGIRSKAIAEDPAKSGFFEPQLTYNEAQMGLKDDVRELGQRLFHRWNVEAHKLICGTDSEDEKDREELMSAFGIDDVAVAASLSALLVSHLGIAPALAAVIAALTVKRFFRPAYQEFCQFWEKKLREENA